MIDSDGFRHNVGIILSNEKGKLFWGRRIGQQAWQFPQGGIHRRESPLQALYRELHEEVGLCKTDVEVMGYTKSWLHYHLPKHLLRSNSNPLCIGQKQMWYMLLLKGGEDKFRLDLSDKPEFDHWRWIDYWQPIQEVIYFKRDVYSRALRELAPLICADVTKKSTA